MKYLLIAILACGCAQFEATDSAGNHIKINTLLKNYDLKAGTSTSQTLKAVFPPYGTIETKNP